MPPSASVPLKEFSYGSFYLMFSKVSSFKPWRLKHRFMSHTPYSPVVWLKGTRDYNRTYKRPIGAGGMKKYRNFPNKADYLEGMSVLCEGFTFINVPSHV